jgi:4-oxalocrotonate tautomerase
MPFVSIRITREGNTPEQKAQVIKEVTETLERVLHKPPEWTHVAIEEVDTDNWGFGGVTTTELRKRQSSRPRAASQTRGPSERSTRHTT